MNAFWGYLPLLNCYHNQPTKKMKKTNTFLNSLNLQPFAPVPGEKARRPLSSRQPHVTDLLASNFQPRRCWAFQLLVGSMFGGAWEVGIVDVHTVDGNQKSQTTTLWNIRNPMKFYETMGKISISTLVQDFWTINSINEIDAHLPCNMLYFNHPIFWLCIREKTLICDRYVSIRSLSSLTGTRNFLLYRWYWRILPSFFQRDRDWFHSWR